MLRYPGGKDRIQNQILEPIAKYYNKHKNLEYREPFFGGGSVGLSLFNKSYIRDIWINDKDYALSCLWTTVIKYPEDLCKKVQEYEPLVSNFYGFKENLLQEIITHIDPIELGFQKLVVHRTSFSGLGVMSGPLGGNNQTGKYKHDARWNSSSINKNITRINKLFSIKNVRKNKCTWLDYSNLLKDNEKDAFIYLDPPYFEQGEHLYLHAFSTHNHVDMRDILKNECKHAWLLSYDDCKEIRDLYSFAHIEEITASYGIVNGRKKQELLICPKEMSWIFKDNQIKIKEIF